MSFFNSLGCVWCSGRRSKEELNLYRQHTLVCIACTHKFKVSKNDYISLTKKKKRSDP